MDAAVRSLFAQVLGPAFDTLPAPVRALHLAQGIHRYRGDIAVERGGGALSRIVAAAPGALLERDQQGRRTVTGTGTLHQRGIGRVDARQHLDREVGPQRIDRLPQPLGLARQGVQRSLRAAGRARAAHATRPRDAFLAGSLGASMVPRQFGLPQWQAYSALSLAV